MGLDMYVRAKRYVSGYFDKDMVEPTVDLARKLGLPDGESYEVSSTCACWRKANSIHAWFVRECARGEDDCKPVYLSREQIKTLRDLCVELLAKRDPKLAEEALAPQSGFFFGNTDINEYYWGDLEDTVKQLTPLLNAPENVDFEYQASW